MTIRKATIHDTQSILPMWIKLMEIHAGEHAIFKTTSDFKEKVINDIEKLFQKPGVTFFIAMNDNEAIGYCITSISTRPSVFCQTKKGYIGDTFVEDVYRDQGIGTKLISTIREWFKEQDVDFIDLQVTKTNEAGIRFWEKNGFEIVNYYMVSYLQK